jgi:hypothetical protein
MTLAIGIDPGTATTGYGLVRIEQDGSLVAVKYGVILTPKDASAAARLEMIYDQLCEFVNQYKPETAAVEKLFFSRNAPHRAVGRRGHAGITKRRGRSVRVHPRKSRMPWQDMAARRSARCRKWCAHCSWIPSPSPTMLRMPWHCDHTFEYEEI